MNPWTRLVLAVSLDGRICYPMGGSSHLGEEGDRKVLEESLAWADGTLMGGNTLKAHKSTCLIGSPNLIKQRLQNKGSEQPISIVVSRFHNHSIDWSFFRQPIKRWLLSPSNDYKKNITNSKIVKTLYRIKLRPKASLSHLTRKIKRNVAAETSV